MQVSHESNKFLKSLDHSIDGSTVIFHALRFRNNVDRLKRKIKEVNERREQTRKAHDWLKGHLSDLIELREKAIRLQHHGRADAQHVQDIINLVSLIEADLP